MNKEVFLKQKINNFIIFIEQKIGKNNSIHNEFVNYGTNLQDFLRDIIQLSKFKIDEEMVQKYLSLKGVQTKLDKKDMEKIQRYFEMFVKVINS